MSSLIQKEQLFDEILLKPAVDFDTLCIVSGFATPSMVAHHLDAVKTAYDKENLKIKLIVGMTPLGIPKPHHQNFIKLKDELGDFFECSYINSTSYPIHTKLYTWLKDNQPQKAFLASANYTLTAFRRSQEELACICSPKEAFDYYNSKINNSIYCNCDDASELIIEKFNTQINSDKNKIGKLKYSKSIMETVKLPLFSPLRGEIQKRAGLNWGQRPGREPNQAYLPIPIDIARSGFFPPNGQQFSVLTEDGFPFICVVAQEKDKAIETPNNNSELGEYFRRRLGVPLGAPVKLDDLDKFGNRYVTFTKIDEEEYYMEYSPV